MVLERETCVSGHCDYWKGLFSWSLLTVLSCEMFTSCLFSVHIIHAGATPGLVCPMSLHECKQTSCSTLKFPWPPWRKMSRPACMCDVHSADCAPQLLHLITTCQISFTQRWTFIFFFWYCLFEECIDGSFHKQDNKTYTCRVTRGQFWFKIVSVFPTYLSWGTHFLRMPAQMTRMCPRDKDDTRTRC